MSDKPRVNWYSVRTIYLFGKKKDGSNIFEERVVVFSAATGDEAFEKAAREADRYVSDHGMARHPWLEAYAQDGDPLIDGYEVWSQLYESTEDLESFVNAHYVQHDYHLDLEGPSNPPGREIPPKG